MADTNFLNALAEIRKLADTADTKRTLGSECTRYKELLVLSNVATNFANKMKEGLVKNVTGKKVKITAYDNNAKPIKYSVTVGRRNKSEVNVEKLYSMVNKDLFLSIVKAGVTDTKVKAGDAIYMKCLESAEGNDTLLYEEV